MNALTHARANINKHVILIAFPHQQKLRERASVLRCTYIACIIYPVNRNQLVDKFYLSFSRILLWLQKQCFKNMNHVCLFLAQQPNMCQDLLTLETIRWHTITTVGKIPLDERSARRRDIYLRTHDIHNRQTSMPPVGFEPTVPANQRP